MSSSKSGNSQIAIRYAKALIELAKEGGLEAIEKDVLAIRGLLEVSDALKTLIQSPLVSRESKEKAFTAVLDQAGSQVLTKRFVAILARNNRLPYIEAIITAFLGELMDIRGEVVAEVVSATPLQGEHLAAITEILTKTLGKKVKVKVVVDKKVLGGLVVKVGSVMLDNSLKSKLDRLGQISSSAVLARAA